MKFGMPKFLKSFDMFGAPVPNINVRGRVEVKTSFGACISMVIFTVTLIFALLKLEHLYQRKNPSITTNKIPLEEGVSFSLDSDDFMIAFALTDYAKKPKNNPRYTRWIVHSFQIVDGKKTMSNHFLQLCTQDDMAKFNPPDSP